MEFRQIESFVRLAECESFSRAAQSLHVSQPTVSAHIAALERELDTALVVRTAKRFALTAEGRAFREQALAMLASRDKALAAPICPACSPPTIAPSPICACASRNATACA